MLHRDHGDAVNGSVLAARVRNSGRAWLRGFSGERTPYQKPARPEVGRAGMPVADEAAYVRIAEQLLPAPPGDLRTADLLAAARRLCESRQRLHPAHAESAD